MQSSNENTRKGLTYAQGGEEHNDTAAVAARSPKPTRRPAPLAVGDQVEDSSRTSRRGPSEFGADIFHTAAENEHGDDEDDESSDSSSNIDHRNVFRGKAEDYSVGSDREATAAAKSAAKKLSKGEASEPEEVGPPPPRQGIENITAQIRGRGQRRRGGGRSDMPPDTPHGQDSRGTMLFALVQAG